MKLQLTEEEIDELLLNIFSDSQMLSYAGFSVNCEIGEYKSARQTLIDNFPTVPPCREEIWLQVLHDGNKIALVDETGSDQAIIISIDKVLSGIENIPIKTVIHMLTGDYYADDADMALQYMLLGDLVYC